MTRKDADLRNRTYDYARRIIRLFRSLPADKLSQTLGSQLLRSATSVGANYREASRARSKAEFTSISGIALRELDESDYWLSLIRDESILPESRLAALIDETNELISIFVKLIKTART